jgi:hypothetical protein
MDLFVAGPTMKQVAAVLGTNAKTVYVHRARLVVKLDVDILRDLVRLAASAGLWPRPAFSELGLFTIQHLLSHPWPVSARRKSVKTRTTHGTGAAPHGGRPRMVV